MRTRQRASEEGMGCTQLTSRDRGADAGGRVGRPDDVRAYRSHAGIEPAFSAEERLSNKAKHYRIIK